MSALLADLNPVTQPSYARLGLPKSVTGSRWVVTGLYGNPVTVFALVEL